MALSWHLNMHRGPRLLPVCQRSMVGGAAPRLLSTRQHNMVCSSTSRLLRRWDLRDLVRLATEVIAASPKHYGGGVNGLRCYYTCVPVARAAKKAVVQSSTASRNSVNR